MADFLTVTMNPALDVFTSVGQVVPGDKLRCGAPRFDPGGGGINVARVLRRLGADVLAAYPRGGASGERLDRLIAAEQVPTLAIAIGGTTRESFTVHETATGEDYRFVLPGPELSAGELRECLARLAALPPPRHLIASGSLPPGAPATFYRELVTQAAGRGTRCVVDASGPALAAALGPGLHLIKPSLRELEALAGAALPNERSQHAACMALLAEGRCEAVALSLGARGALLCTGGGTWRADAVPTEVASTIGAGDSFLAALVWALDRGGPPPDALRSAIAAGTAALRTPGTALCRPEDIARIEGEVRVRALGA